VQRTADVLDSEIDGETVMLSIDSGRYFGLNGVGSVIWQLLREPRSIDQICGTLVERYDVKPDACTAEVTRFLEHLVGAGIVLVIGGVG